MITTESREVFIVRANTENNIRGFCFQCEGETEILTLDESVSLSGIATRDILRRGETGEIHFLETVNGHLLVCRNSLAGRQQKDFEKKRSKAQG